tara:strand:+ start:3292 stop:3450 length:159 start_codon:yes stop_codon:yes gene_type:complete
LSFSHRLLKFTKSLKAINVGEKYIVLTTKKIKNIIIAIDIKPIPPRINFKKI